jgi:hypothetical protein
VVGDNARLARNAIAAAATLKGFNWQGIIKRRFEKSEIGNRKRHKFRNGTRRGLPHKNHDEITIPALTLKPALRLILRVRRASRDAVNAAEWSRKWPDQTPFSSPRRTTLPAIRFWRLP